MRGLARADARGRPPFVTLSSFFSAVSTPCTLPCLSPPPPSPCAPQRVAAERVLKQFQEHPDAWTRADRILETSQNQQTKFFALQVLETAIKQRWGALPEEQRQGIRNYVSNLIIAISTNEQAFRSQRVFLNKLNLVLVDILKQDWPHKWPSFIPDIVGAARTDANLCENCMVILRLLSEEVFDFGRLDLTSAKAHELKQSFNEQFAGVHELCLAVLGTAAKPDLIKATLRTLHAFLSWVPLGYIFESDVVGVLLGLFPNPAYRNLTLQCLGEIGALSTDAEYEQRYVALFGGFAERLAAVLPPDTDVAAAYAAGTDEDEAFVQYLAIFLTALFRHHLPVLEAAPQLRPHLLTALGHLVRTSYVENDEVFKICLDYWAFFVPDVYSTSTTTRPDGAGDLAPGAFGAQAGANPLAPFGSPAGGAAGAGFAFGAPGAAAAPAAPGAGPTSRRELYASVLSSLRALMIARMAKPEEVIVVEDENGNVVREAMKDTDVLARYRTMHETLVYLSHLDHEDTERQMMERLRQQMARRGEGGWGSLNRLCWAVGSISGSMVEEQESRFLITVIRDLLNLCEITRGKDNKAVIASNIMYVVGQYPRFLRNHWKFLKTVVNKLFEFMHETHPGVQDMACETFLKIVNRCKRKFVVQQQGETEPFVSELLTGLTATIADLEPHQIHTFYETVGIIIGADPDAGRREAYLARLMAPPNATWRGLLAAARADVSSLQKPEALRGLQNILQTNLAVAQALGAPYAPQLDLLYLDALAVYKMCSELLGAAVAAGGPHAARTSQAKLLRSVRKVVLKLLEAFVERAEDLDALAQRYAPPLEDPVLGDYARGVPDARDAEVLSLYAALIDRLKGRFAPAVPRVFEAVFEPTLTMITRNFEDYPEHRLAFFGLLRAIATACPGTLFEMTPAQLKLVVDSIVWAFRHTERNVAETGLNLLLEILVTFSRSPAAGEFYRAYYALVLREIFAVMTDTFHKPGFKLHARILHHLFAVAGPQGIQEPIFSPDQTMPDGRPAAGFASNAEYASALVTGLLSTSFPNLRENQVRATVLGMMQLRDFPAFKQHLRDFLVQANQFADQDNAELYADDVAGRTGQTAQPQGAAPNVPGLAFEQPGAADA